MKLGKKKKKKGGPRAEQLTLAQVEDIESAPNASETGRKLSELPSQLDGTDTYMRDQEPTIIIKESDYGDETA